MIAPDLVLTNATLLCPERAAPGIHHLAVGGGKILGIFDDYHLALLHPAAGKVIDCRGRTIVPGFIDGHGHLKAFAESLVIPDISPRNGIRSIIQIQDLIRRRAASLPEGAWIVAVGYDEHSLTEKRHPVAVDLDAAAPHHAVLLKHRSGHAHVLSTLAMQRCGIALENAEPPQGLIDRAIPSGQPTGLLFEMGRYLAERVPALDQGLLDQGVALASRRLLAEGVTFFEDAGAGNDASAWRRFGRWKKEGMFSPRLQMRMGYDALEWLEARQPAPEMSSDEVSLGGVKIILDETTGRLMPRQDQLDQMVLKAHRRGLSVAIHAVTQTAVSSACSAFETALTAYPASSHRHRIEHGSVCDRATARRMAALGVMVVTQPGFIYYNGDRYLDTVDQKELADLYPIGRWLKQGVAVAAGSDCPVVPPSPLAGLAAAVTRRTASGRVLGEDQRISLAAALALHTTAAAAAVGQERCIGRLTEGMRADVVVLSHDPTQIPPGSLLEIKVEMTLVGGRVAWSREQ
jgi:predicted amidohydrolase YtcJ